MKTASSELLLLDLNVLLAIAWPNHQFHSIALAALARHNPWATCALTQLGFIRLSSNPSAIAGAKSPQQCRDLLAQLVADAQHIYLDSLPEPAAHDCAAAFASLLGHQQVNDAYLLRVAAAHDATLVTFDRRLQNLSANQQKILVLG